MNAPRTLFDKLWDDHVVVPETVATPAILAIDLHLVHEVTSAQAFATLRERQLPLRSPERTAAFLREIRAPRPPAPSIPS